ncbi:hypothetical protein VIGAN_07228500 [Vigna angularis var. angularis]|uniref:Uncharacterized protein n=1 Tax=Vigna angularis var. angularis TaxID=157739 RepID=A0A0S3SKE9_PHAAN|nr:hypothetical protein VIGAN_07228500 [Vigna angularis var. angularis]
MRSSRQPATVPYPENQDTCITLASISQTWKTHPSLVFGPIIIYPPAFLWQCIAQSHLSTKDPHLQLSASNKNAPHVSIHFFSPPSLFRQHRLQKSQTWLRNHLTLENTYILQIPITSWNGSI